MTSRRTNNEPMQVDSVTVATGHYYWKPMTAIFRSFELEEYARAGVRFHHPILDLGCGDGTFGMLLRDRGILDGVDVGIDYSLREVRNVPGHSSCRVAQADSRALPLKGATFGSVVANGVLPCVETNLSQAISEVGRVLRKDGVFVLTVPTPWFEYNLFIPKLLRKVRLHSLADWMSWRQQCTRRNEAR